MGCVTTLKVGAGGTANCVNAGRVASVRGSVVDMRFDTRLPPIHTMLRTGAGQQFAQSISFDQPVTASMVRVALRRTVGMPLELWGRSSSDVLLQPR